ncbi:TKL protein kinase [Phytophthora nicotianae P1976]|uniref:TKL protein kinase n=1 Tax=Phytophthora nicotianae P1976 TaxID=1317066 RepID=A0A080ZGY8_PHYNI|nr:TKL protein kinase [Phytophthora nicotianae P1976]
MKVRDCLLLRSKHFCIGTLTQESLNGTAVNTIADAAVVTAETITSSSTSSPATATSSSGSKSSTSSSTNSITTPTSITTTAPRATTATPTATSAEMPTPDVSDSSSAPSSSSAFDDIPGEASSSYLSSSGASSGVIGHQEDESQVLNTGAIVGVMLSCFVLLLGLLAFWRGRHKRWFRKTPSTIYVTATNRSTTPVAGLSPFHTRNLDSSELSNVSAPIQMWEDEDITAMRIPFEKITMMKLINYGGHGKVYLGTYRDEQVVIKRLLPEKRKKLNEVNAFLAEIKMMASVEHPRIVRLIGVAWDSLTDLCAVSEFMDGGDLHSLLKHYETQKRPHGFDFSKARIALHVAHALAYLHSLEPIILHRDLKSMNILLTSKLKAKITDFEVSRQCSVDTMTAGVGTALWMAPEVMMGEHYGASADIFSFGIVLSELDSHFPPYREMWSSDGQKISNTAILEMVSSGQLRIEFSPNAPLELVDLVTRVWIWIRQHGQGQARCSTACRSFYGCTRPTRSDRRV